MDGKESHYFINNGSSDAKILWVTTPPCLKEGSMIMDKKKLIQFRNIVKEFDGQIVLKGVNLDIYENEFVTLLGPSGVWKDNITKNFRWFSRCN